MIKVVARNFIKEENTGDFIELTMKLIEKTTQNDEGCIKYELFQDINNANIFTIIEEWENKSMLEKHMKSKHFLEIVPLFGNFTEKQGEINVYKKVE
jgi:quinol monooxygenase YgiN